MTSVEVVDVERTQRRALRIALAALERAQDRVPPVDVADIQYALREIRKALAS